MGKQDIVQVLLVDGTVVVVFLHEEATAFDLIKAVVDDISLNNRDDLDPEYSDWVAILLPPDAQVGFQEVLNSEGNGEAIDESEGLNGRIIDRKEKVFKVLSDETYKSSQHASFKATKDVHDLSQNLHRAYFKVLNIHHQIKVALKEIQDHPDGENKSFYISPSSTSKDVLELLVSGLNLPIEDGEGKKNQPEHPPYSLTIVKSNNMDLETTEQLQDSDLILPVYFEHQKKVLSGEIQRFEVRLSSQENWFSKMGTMTSRLTQNFSRPLSVFAFFGEGSSKVPTSTIARRENSIKTRIASPTRMLRHMSLTGKDSESGIDFSNIATWNLGDFENNHRRTILDPSFGNEWAATYPIARGVKKREKLDNLDDDDNGEDIQESPEFGPDESELDRAFNRVLDELNIKAGVRAKMMDFPPGKKMELIEQNDAVQRMKNTTTPTPMASHQSTPLSRPKSMSSNHASSNSAEIPGSAAQASLEHLLSTGRSPPKGGGSITGYLFGNLFSSATNHPEGSVEYYLSRLNSKSITPQEMFKCLQSLRITLSSAAVTWIRSFLEDGTALTGMESLLERLIVKNLCLADTISSARVQDLEEDVHLECVRCLRTLLNTEPGFHEVLQHPAIIQCIAFSINTSSDKLRNIVAEVLAAICVLSKDGHHQVLDAFSDFRLKFHEDHRFQYLLNSLHSPVSIEGISAIAAHDFKTTCLSFINAMVNTPETLDERMLLREEFRRRGLKEIFSDLRENYPQESLSKQMECYEEETEADVNEMKEHILIDVLESEQLDPLLGLAESLRVLHPESGLRTVSKEIVSLTNNLLSVEVDDEIRYEVLNLGSKFLHYSSRFIDSEDWALAFLGFFDEIRDSIGLSLQEILESDDKFKEELAHYHSLAGANVELQQKLEASEAQLHKIKSMPMLSYILSQETKDDDLLKSPKDNFTVMVQRLVQKEKEIASLQDKIDVLKSTNKSPSKEKSEESSWSAFKQELDIQKQENKELSEVADARGKEIAYLKRSLEAVCTRFQLTVNELVPENLDLNPQTSTEPSDLISIPELQILQAEFNAAKKELAEKENLESQNIILNNTVMELRHQLEKNSQLKSSSFVHDLSDAKELGLSINPLEDRIGLQSTPLALVSDLTPTLKVTTPDGVITSHAPPPPPPPPPGKNQPKPSAGPPPPPPPPPPMKKPIAGPPPPPPPPIQAGKKSLTSPKNNSSNESFFPSDLSGLLFSPDSKGNSSSPINSGLHATSMSSTSINEMLKPKVPMKSLFWKKIPNSKIPNTLWELPIEEAVIPRLDQEQLEVLFCKKVSKKPGSGYTSIGRRIKGKKSITLIDLNRANNIAITLARMKMPFSAIKLAILEVNDSRLSMDNLRSLEGNAPTQEEIKLVKSYVGSIDNLGTAEKYILQIMDIPRLSERLNCMIFRRRFDADVEELLPELEVMTKVTHELRESKLLKSLLEVTLALGNYLNTDTPRGDAKGFKFEGLKLLKDVKANSRKDDIPIASLLHYLAFILEDNWSMLFKVREEFPSMDAAARVSVTTLTNNIYSLSQGVKQVNHELRAHKKLISLAENDQFISTMDKFVVRASRIASEIKEKGEQLERSIEELLTYFGEDSSTKPEDFLNSIISFLDALENARIENTKLKEKAVQKGYTPIKRTPVPTATKLPGFGQGDFDVAVRELRSGLRRKRTERPRSQMFSGNIRALPLDGASGPNTSELP